MDPQQDRAAEVISRRNPRTMGSNRLLDGELQTLGDKQERNWHDPPQGQLWCLLPASRTAPAPCQQGRAGTRHPVLQSVGALPSALSVPGQRRAVCNTYSLAPDLSQSPQHFECPSVEFSVWCSGCFCSVLNYFLWNLTKAKASSSSYQWSRQIKSQRWDGCANSISWMRFYKTLAKTCLFVLALFLDCIWI